MKSKKKNENTFEHGMETLTRLADQLESGDLGLDESLLAFEEGVKLYRKLQEQLENARLKIETIMAENEPENSQGEEAEDGEL